MTSETTRSLVHFFLPPEHLLEAVSDRITPTDIATHNEASGEILQTYVQLKNSGFPCELVQELPSQGIVVAHRDALAPLGSLHPTPALFLICLQTTRQRSSYAQMHVVSSPAYTALIENSHYLSPWPNPAIRPRTRPHPQRFSNIAYMGHLDDLATELKQYSFREKLHELGLRWSVRSHLAAAHDYTDVDAIIAIRHLTLPPRSFSVKTPQQLHNAWQAGVPAILGCDSEYRALRQSELDYVEIGDESTGLGQTGLEQVIQTLSRLQKNPGWRQAIVAQGQKRAQAITPLKLAAQWSSFLISTAIPAYHYWQTLSAAVKEAWQLQRRQRCHQENQAVHMRESNAISTLSSQLPLDLSEKS